MLICGTYVFPEVFPALSGAFAPDAKVIHIDLNGYEIAKNFPVDLGLISDPKTTLAALGKALESMMTPEQQQEAFQRSIRIAEAKKQQLTTKLESDPRCNWFKAG